MRLLKNFLTLAGAEMVSKVATFAAIAYLARMLGPADYGYIEFAGAVVMCAALVIDQGFGPYGAREIAKTPTRTAALVAEIVLTRFILASVSGLGIVALAVWLAPAAPVQTLLVVYALSLLATPLLLQWVFQGHDRMDIAAALQAVRQVVFAGVVFALVRVNGPLWPVALAETLGVGAAAVFGLWMLRRIPQWSMPRRITLSARLFKEGVPIGLSQMFWTVRMFGATLILGLIAAPQDVGFFGGAQRILIALHAFVWLYYFNLLPTLARTWQLDVSHFSVLIRQSLHTVAWLGAVCSLVWVALAPWVMISVYGAAFAPAGVILQWLAGVFLMAALSGHYRYGLIATGHQTAEMTFSVLGAITALTLIPVGYAYGGPTGAAIGLLVAEIVVWGAAWAWARHRLGLRGHHMCVAPPFLALSLALLILHYLPFTSLSLRLGVALAVLVGLMWMVDREMRHRLQRLAFLGYTAILRRGEPVEGTL